MKKFVSILTALCMAAGCSITASANELHDRYDEWRAAALDDGGMFRGYLQLFRNYDYFLMPCDYNGTDTVITYEADDLLQNGVGAELLFCVPAQDLSLMVLKSTDCYEQVSAVFARYFPAVEVQALNGAITAYPTGTMEPCGMENAYWIQNFTRQHNIEQDDDWWEKFSKELYDADLISEFYAPGYAWCKSQILYVPYLTGYAGDNPYLQYAAKFDADSVQAYIDTTELACTLQTRETQWGETMYYVVPNEKTDIAGHMALARQLYDALGIVPFAELQPTSIMATAQNNGFALSQRTHAEEYTGDLNLDNMLNVSDAVLMARLVAGDSTLEIADAARANADMNADGMFTADDLTMLLKQLVRE